MMSESEAAEFADHIRSTSGEPGLTLCAVAEDDHVIAAAVCAPEAFSNNVWNLHFIAVDPSEQGRGTGSLLLSWIEKHLAEKATALVIDTSDQDSFSTARLFYTKRGYQQVGRIPDYWAPLDSKVTFWKSLGSATEDVDS
jgi:GNAT superfamily N-acetyltransferase